MNTPAALTIAEGKALRTTILCLALLGGLGLFLGYPNPFGQIPPLALLFPAVLVTFSRIMPTAKGSFYAGWLCASLGNSACLYWVSVPMHDYGLVPWPLTVPAVLALGAYLGLYGGLFSLIYRVFREYLPFPAALLCVWPLWTAVDIAKEVLFTGFPWVCLATAFVAWPDWVQAAAVVGGNVLSGLFAMSATAVAEARPIRLMAGFSPTIIPKRRQRFSLVVGIVPMFLVYACAFMPTLPEGRSLTIGLVQGNVDQNQKWHPAYQAATLARYLDLSARAVDPALGYLAKPVELLIWPETAMPFYFEDTPLLADKIMAFTARFGVPVVFGAPGRSDREDGVGYYNRLWLQTQDPFGTQHYDKMHLVPFGEYVPLDIPLPFIEYLMQGMDFIPGTTTAPLKTGDLALGGLICYEAIFSELAQERVAEGANLLVNISNDAWFGATSAPVQHLHLTALRAVEQGRYLARATNTGISAIISPRGIVTAQGPLFAARTLVGFARLIDGTTVYHRLRPFLVWGSILLAAAAAAWCGIRARRGKKQPPTYW